jgi:hypothetical protein
MTDSQTAINEIDKKLAENKQQQQVLQAELHVPTAKTSLPAWWSVTDAMTVSSVVLLFGVVTMLLVAGLLKSGRESEAVLRVFGTVLILVSTLFLIVAGYSSQQIAPALGLLGTIAGYLLGKGSNVRSDATTKEAADKKP